MKVTNYGLDHPFAVIRGRVAGVAAVGTATLSTLNLVIITPTALAADTDDWNPTGLVNADAIRASSSANVNLTGIVAPSDDRLVILENIGTNVITLKHDQTSTAANRFYLPDDSDLALDKDSGVWLLYDLTSARWRVLGGGGSGGGDGITPYYIASGTSFTVPIYKQSLFTETIDVIGTLIVDGHLLAVT